MVVLQDAILAKDPDLPSPALMELASITRMSEPGTDKPLFGNPLRAVAGVIQREDRYLIGQRLPDDNYGGLWEFPGGKIEPGESTQQCLERELMEELGVRTEIGALICTVQPSERFHLTVHRASITEGELELREHTELLWVTLEELDGFDLLPADRPVIQVLAREVEGSDQRT
jgi:mutator protein MutT